MAKSRRGFLKGAAAGAAALAARPAAKAQQHGAIVLGVDGDRLRLARRDLRTAIQRLRARVAFTTTAKARRGKR